MSNEKIYLVVEAARDLLYAIALLRQQSYEINQVELHHLMLEKVDSFTTLLEKKNFPLHQVNYAKYLICAALDEAGASYSTNRRRQTVFKNLISHYYNEELGGENFFIILENLKSNPTENLPVISLAYLLLCLGFEGQYAIREKGENMLKETIEKTYLLIKQYNYNPSLLASNRAEIKPDKLKKINFVVPLFFLLTLIFILFVVILNYKKQQLHKQLNETIIKNLS